MRHRQNLLAVIVCALFRTALFRASLISAVLLVRRRVGLVKISCSCVRHDRNVKSRELFVNAAL